MKLSRLKGRKTSERLLREGNVWKGNTFVVRWTEGAPRLHQQPSPKLWPSKGFGEQARNQRVNTVAQCLFVGALISAKTEKSAVKRNRMKRRCKEAFRKEVKERSDLPTMQLLLAPRRSSLECDFEEIVSDVREFLSHVT